MEVVALSCIPFRITRRCAFTNCERSSYCSAVDKVAHPTGNSLAVTTLPRKEAGFLATPAKIIRPPTRREVEDFNLYQNAKRGFKRANNATFPFNTLLSYRIYDFDSVAQIACKVYIAKPPSSLVTRLS